MYQPSQWIKGVDLKVNPLRHAPIMGLPLVRTCARARNAHAHMRVN